MKYSHLNTFQISFKKIGMKEYSGDAKGLGQVLTLKDAVQLMGDAGRKISYLKVRGQKLSSNIFEGKK